MKKLVLWSLLAAWFAVASAARGATATNPSPANFATADTHTTTMKDFLARKSKATTTYASDGMFFAYSSTGSDSKPPASYRAAFGEDYKVNGIVKLSWKGTSGTSTVKITRLSDGNVRTLTTSGTSVDFLAPEIGRNYKWTVTNGGTESGPWYFFTDGEAPRIIPQELAVVGNCRDMGGWVTADGNYRVRQGLGYRNDHNDDFVTYEQLKPFWTDIAKIKTDMDLRDKANSTQWYCNYELDENANHPGRSPYGEHWWDVLYWNVVREGDYGAVMNAYAALVEKIGASPASTDSKKASVNTWKLFADAENLPIVVHCSQGRDRTGTVAFVLLGALGVGLNDLYADWALTDYSAPSDFPKGTSTEGGSTIVALYNALEKKYPNATYPTLQDKCEKLLQDMGVSDAQLANLKSYWLEPVEAKLTAVPAGTSVAVPTLSASRVTKSNAKKPTVAASSHYTVDYGGGGYTDYGKYLVTVTLKEPTTTHWADGTIGPKVLPFIIEHSGNVVQANVLSFIQGDTSPHIRIARPCYLGEVKCDYTEEQLNALAPGDYEATFTAKACEMASKVNTTTNKFKVYPATEKATYTYEYADLKSAFFKTDYAPAIQTDKVEVRMMDQTAGEGYAPFSCGPYPASMTIMKMSDGVLRYANGAQRVDNDPGTWTVNKIYKLTAQGKTISHTEEATQKTVTKSISSLDAVNPTPGTAYIGCAVEKTANMGAEGTPGDHQPHRIYHVKAWANGSSLIHEFVPCKTTSGYAMLYDKVTKKLYPFSHTCDKTGSVTLGGTATKIGGGDDPDPSPTPDTKAVTYTWKGGTEQWAAAASWTPGTGATYGYPDHATYATADFPSDVTAATTCTLASDVSVQKALFDSPNLTFVLDNAALTVASTYMDTTTWGAYNFGNTKTGNPTVEFKGTKAAMITTHDTVRANFGYLGGDTASGTCTLRFTVPATGWETMAPIRAAGSDSKVVIASNVELAVDATALGVPAAGETATVLLASSTDGMSYSGTATVTCASGAHGEVAVDGNDLVLKVTGEVELPAGYMAVDYIVAPRDSYIDTGYKPNQNSHVTMDVNVQGADEYWFGCWDRNYNDGAFAFGNDGTGVYAGYGNQGGTFGSVVAAGRHIVELDGNEVKVDGVGCHSFTNESFALTNNLYLFAQNRKGTAYVQKTQEKIVCYGCTIKEGAALKRNFLPCIRETDEQEGFYDTVGGSFYHLLRDIDPTQNEYSEEYLKSHDFTSETFVEFNRWEEDRLAGFLTAAVWAMQNAQKDYKEYPKYGRTGPIGVVCTNSSYAYINVRITLRNPQKENWRLGSTVIDLIRELANGHEKDGKISVSLVIEANPDYFPTSQTYLGIPIINAFRSLDLVGGPIIISTEEKKPIIFDVYGYEDQLKTKGYSTSVLYGLSFAYCANEGGKGGAVRGGNSHYAADSLHAVRIINCTFSNCKADQGGAVYHNAGNGSVVFQPSQSLRFRSDFPGSDLKASDTEGIEGSHFYHCTFENCTSKSFGGAIHGDRSTGNTGTVVTDCTFRNCSTEGVNGGGAVYQAQTAYRCAFSNCKATGGKGGGCESVYNVVSSVFWDCSSNSGGGAIDREQNAWVNVVACTLHNCTSENDHWAIAVYPDNPVVGCLLVNAPLDNADKYEDGTKNRNDSGDGSWYFIAPKSDYHLNPDNIQDFEMNNVPGMYTAGPIYIGGAEKWTYDSLYDRDGYKLINDGHPTVSGCYRGYTPKQWEEEKARNRPWEWKSMNPLEVTVSEDVFDPKDGKISFREACLYLERHQTAPLLVCEDQWPRITFALPASSRTVEVTNVVSLSDERRTAVFGEGLSGRQPVVIDGGTQGMTIRNIGRGGELLDLSVAGSVNNVLFSDGSVTVGTNGAPEVGKIRVPLSFTNQWGVVGTTYENRDVPNELNVRFDNCAFEGGAGDRWLASSKSGNVRFAGCTFLNAADGQAKGAVSLNVVSNQVAQFECCTFSGLAGASCVIAFMDCGGELRLANCTFADNDDVMADVLIAGKPNVHGTFRAFNCIFADGNKLNPTNACVVINGEPNILCPLWPSTRYDPEKKGELMVNIATDSPSDVLDSERITRYIRGVRQCAYRPKHRSTARYGRDSYRFGDGPTMRQPAVDIFQTPQPGAYHSMGSFYVDDVESPSINVSTGEDVTDPYDDEISLREAIAYGGSAADGRFVKDQAVTPTFGDGVTSLSVTGAIRIAANTTYRDFALKIGPTNGCDLTIGSGTNSQDGVFVQEAGTKLLQFDRVRFSRCGTLGGAGGVLKTAGRYRFDDCTFDRCWGAGLSEPAYDEMLADVGNAIKKLGDAGLGDFGLSKVGAITNAQGQVAEVKRKVAEIYADPTRSMSEVYPQVVAASGQLGAAVNDAYAVLKRASLELGVKLIFPDMLLPAEQAALNGAENTAKNWLLRLSDDFGSGGIGQGGGAIVASESADGIFHNVSASGCLAAGAGGVIANAGRLVGVNLTFCRNEAASGAAVHCSDGTNLFASVAFVDNVSKTNGAVHAEGGVCGIVNSLIVGNVDSAGVVCNITAADGVMTDVQYTLSGADVTKADVFANGGESIIAVTSNRAEHLYYPLDSMGLASGTGAYVFFLTEKGGDDLDNAGWIKGVLYSTDPDDFKPKPLVGGKASFNTRLLHDQLGNLIESWDWRNRRALPASMGPVPKINAIGPSAVVTTTKDDASASAGTTTLRSAAEYAMTNGIEVTFADGLFAGGATPVFELTRQIDVPGGSSLRIVAGSGRTVELRPAEAEWTNKFFTVFEGGSLALSGITLQGGCAHVDSPYVQLEPANPSNGGAVQGFGPMAFTNCIFRANTAPGHGGAIYSSGGLTLSGCLFETNCAGLYGGAVYSDCESLEVSGSTFTDNVAQKGGAIYINGSSNDVRILMTDIVANSALAQGGGLYLQVEDEDRIAEIRGVDTRIIGNKAGESSDNVFVGDRVTFDESNVQRVPNEYVRVVTDGGLPRIVLDVEKATPVLCGFDVGEVEDGKVTVGVDNVVIGLWYGIGRSETPVGPYVVDEWVRAKPGETLKLTAPKEGASGFYRIIARE